MVIQNNNLRSHTHIPVDISSKLHLFTWRLPKRTEPHLTNALNKDEDLYQRSNKLKKDRTPPYVKYNVPDSNRYTNIDARQTDTNIRGIHTPE